LHFIWHNLKELGSVYLGSVPLTEHNTLQTIVRGSEEKQE